MHPIPKLGDEKVVAVVVVVARCLVAVSQDPRLVRRDFTPFPFRASGIFRRSRTHQQRQVYAPVRET